MSVDYEISWQNPNERLYDVEIRFRAPEDQPTLMLPAWRPGRYLMQNFAANVREWSASAPVGKSGTARWRVAARAGEEVTMRYRYYAGILDAGSSFLDPREAYFNGSNLLMMIDGMRSEPTRLTVRTAPGWEIETQLPCACRDGIATFLARDYDHLIDSPVIASPSLRRHTFEECDTTFHLVFVGAEGLDTEQYVEPLRATIRAQAAIFGGLPVRAYRFLYHVTDRWHGVEHEESCSITVRREPLVGARPGSEGYDHFLSISAHELFHLWNVKRIMPKVFLPYDYMRETPTGLLWAMEGITSYFGDLSLARAGVWDEEHYLQHLAKEINAFESSPARLHLSLSQASYDGWLQDPTRPHDRGNAWYSFYNKGEIVAALLDLTIRSRSGKSLDDVMRYLWDEYGLTPVGLEEDAIERAVERVAGAGYEQFFSDYVDGTRPLPYPEILGQAGIEVDSQNRPPSLGAKLRTSDGTLVVDAVTRGGTAMAAGVLPGDELIAVAGTRTRTPADAERIVEAMSEGDALDLVIGRSGLVERHEAVLRSDGSCEVKLSISDPTNELRRRWMGRADG